MKREISLKWSLTISVTVVIAFVMAAIGVFFYLFITDVNTRLLNALETRAESSAKTINSEIAFEVAARITDEALNSLRPFMKKHEEAHTIAILLPDLNPFVMVMGEEVEEEIPIQELVKAFESLDETNKGTIGDLVVATSPIRTEGETEVAGYVIYTESLKEYNDFIKRSIITTLAAVAAGLILIMLGAFVTGTRTAAPLNKLVAAAGRIANGDLRSVNIEVGGSFETKRLSASIKQMANALQSQVIAIKAITKDVSGVSREVASAMTHLASSASEQAAAVTETASTVEEMEKAGKSAAGNANQIVDAAEKTTEASIRGRNAVETTSEIILMIKDDSQDISEKSKNLLSSVEEVGNIINSVNGIAEQSKILAVNASIEAAKAGEYGSGFAVVAQEVKDLAQQSKDATLQITDTLTAIRQAIENMVSTAQSGEERTDEGVRMIANAGAIMNDLADAIRENSEFANVIATNINQQTVGLTQIATAIEEINSTALENQDISRKIEHSTRQMTGSVDQLSELVGKWQTPESTPETLTGVFLNPLSSEVD